MLSVGCIHDPIILIPDKLLHVEERGSHFSCGPNQGDQNFRIPGITLCISHGQLQNAVSTRKEKDKGATYMVHESNNIFRLNAIDTLSSCTIVQRGTHTMRETSTEVSVMTDKRIISCNGFIIRF